ncbi:hypothetical protein ACQEV4_09895 [Streptomyces shenzhenensis]|uniref:hypothetical protein n=1 Tax=Streptomyces shenzhenensis TaxID=943815 RepID=UPI003D94543A
MRGMRLDELIGRLRRDGLDLTAEDVADAVWLAQRLGGVLPRDAPPTPDPAPFTPAQHPPGPGPQPATRPDAPETPARPAPDVPSAPVPLHTAGAAPHGHTDATHSVFPVRAPAAGALPGLLGLEKALRALGRYRFATDTPRDEEVDEEATADRAAASGVLLPVTRPGRRHRCDVQLLMDTGPAMAVWGQLVEELRQACQQSGAFASVRVHHLYGDDSGTPWSAPPRDPARTPGCAGPTSCTTPPAAASPS